MRNLRLDPLARGLVSNDTPRAPAGQLLLRRVVVPSSQRQLRSAVNGSGDEDRKAESGMKWIYALVEMFADVYRGSVERQRHACEEDVRRLGGKVTWEDCQ